MTATAKTATCQSQPYGYSTVERSPGHNQTPPLLVPLPATWCPSLPQHTPQEPMCWPHEKMAVSPVKGHEVGYRTVARPA